MNKFLWGALTLGNLAFFPVEFPALCAVTVLSLGAAALAWPVMRWAA